MVGKKNKIKPRLKVERELWRGELCEMTMLMAAVQVGMTTVNKPAEADLHCHPTRGKSHAGQVPKKSSASGSPFLSG